MQTNTVMTTYYPPIQKADPGLPSLADYPMDIVMLVIEACFQAKQIIAIDIFGPAPLQDGERDWDGRVSRGTRVALKPPPLYALTAVSRLFRYMYRKSRPTLWGTHLFWSRSYYVDLSRDIFQVRLKRVVHPLEWDRRGNSDTDYLAGCLSDIEHMAVNITSIVVANKWILPFFRHLNPLVKEFMILFPNQGVENDYLTNGGLELSPVLMPLKRGSPIQPGCFSSTWGYVRRKIAPMMQVGRARCLQIATPEQRARWERTFRLAPVQELKGYSVDKRRLTYPT